MIGSRFQPLFALMALGAAVLLVRLWDVQVRDHPVWALEAARLVHAGREIPYRRGSLLDRDGEVLARDVDGYELELVYREFRRDHPLGLVAHALSLLEARAVPLPEASRQLQRTALALVRLTPADWRAFSRGERFRFDGAVVPATADPEGELRGRRALDLSFYLRKLLDLEPREWKALVEAAEGPRASASFLELVAARRRHTPAQEEERLLERLEASLAQLERLSRLLPWPEDEPAADADDATLRLSRLAPLERIVHELERARRWVEDAAASKLFLEATGFSPGRVAPATLLYFFDVAWIAERVGWNAPRTAEWAEAARAGWLASWRDGYALPRLVWSLALDPVTDHGLEELLDRVAAVFAPPYELARALDGRGPSWRELERLAVFDELPRLFATRLAPRTQGIAALALPLQYEAARALPYDAPGLVPSLTRLPDAAEREEALREALAAERLSIRRVDDLLAGLGPLVADWEDAFQEALRAALEATLASADPDELSPVGELRLAGEHVRRALEGADFHLKDFGMRPRPLVRGEPSYDVVYLLTRYEEDFPGIRAREVRRRDYVELPGDDPRPADRVLGSVSSVPLHALMRQRDEERLLRALKRQPRRTEEEQEELRRLVGEVHLHDEVEGVAGLEAFFNRELTGRNGYLETRGLENVFGEGRERVSVREPEDGLHVVTTIDTGLQEAAQRTLRHPVAVPDDPKFDWAWHAQPVGAIAFLAVDGQVLAAASEPDEASLVDETSSGQRAQRSERCFRKPTFQPPGSVFKPFVAAYALEHGLDPARTVNCAPLPDGRAGYVDLHCWNEAGHGEVDLHAALVGSCNAYFAWLGETFRDADFHALATLFGFGEGTGVDRPLPWDRGDRRRGRLEDVAGFARRRDRPLPLTPAMRRMAGNGLGVVEATPMQVARAMLALATAELRPLSLALQVGLTPLPTNAGLPLPVDADVLGRVRSALRGVVADPAGTARAALSPAALGLDVSAKTGSADIVGSRDDEGRSIVRKHTWVAGWVPAEDPVAIFCVFEHDTKATSSHGAIYLTRQFLQQPEVLAWLAERGVDTSRAEAR